MKLTRLLMFYKHHKKVPGNLYTGKHRIIPKITRADKQQALDRAFSEQENLLLLSKPYLTTEEETGHMADMGRKGIDFHAMLEKKRSNMLPHSTIAEHLEHLNLNKRWE